MCVCVRVKMPNRSETSPAIHNITFCGLTGAIFFLLTAAVILYTEGFINTSWAVKSNGSAEKFEGLWQTCTYHERRDPTSWLTTTQVLVSIGFFGVIVSFVLATIYMTANRASKNVTITSLTFVCFVTVVFSIIGVGVFGASSKASELSWSYGVTVAATGLTFFAGVLSILQLRRSNVRVC